MTSRDWTFRPNPKRDGCPLTWFQSWIVTREQRNVVAVAARRSGKTVGARAKLLTKAVSTTNGLVGYVGPTQKQAKRLIWRALMRDLRDPRARNFVADINRNDLSVEFKSGTVLYVYGAERPEQIRGDGFDMLIVDEADDPNYDDVFFDEIVGPALSDQLGQLIQIGSPKGRGRLYREFRKGQASSPDEERDSTYASIQVPAWTAGIIADEEIERARRTRPKRAFDQEYGATFNAPIGVIYEDWDQNVHVVSRYPDPRRVSETFACVDWGTAHRGVMLVVQTDRVSLPATDDYEACELARAWVVAEESHSGVGYDDAGWWEIARRLQARWQPSTWYADPAGGLEGYIRQLRNALDGSAERPNVVPADNQVRPGISAVAEFLHPDPVGGPRLLVHESCKWLQKHFPSYRWRSHASVEDDFTDEPVKRDDDELDCLRYGIFSHFYEPLARKRGRRGIAHLEDRGR